MLERHHCLHGSGRRKLAEEDGLWVWLCRDCHNEIHFGKDGKSLDLFLQKEAQRTYMKEHGFTNYMKRYGKNYL